MAKHDVTRGQALFLWMARKVMEELGFTDPNRFLRKFPPPRKHVPYYRNVYYAVLTFGPDEGLEQEVKIQLWAKKDPEWELTSAKVYQDGVAVAGFEIDRGMLICN